MVPGWQPRDPQTFGLHVQVFAGDPGDDRSDSFDITVCTPTWLAAQLADPAEDGPQDHIWGSGLLIVNAWSPEVVRDAIEQALTEVEPGPDWGAVADRAGRLIPWEFSYKYDQHVDRYPGSPYP